MSQNNSNNTSSVSSANSNRFTKSLQSFTSLGIGSGCINEFRFLQKKLDIELIKPRADNSQLSDESSAPTYDCIMFLIYCTEHDRFAVTDVNDDHRTIWLPFVVRDGRNWSRASEAGLLSMFEKRDSDGMVVNHVNIPHTSKMIELCHLQTVSGRWIQRATQFVTITKCQNTCQPINTIRWMDAGTILKDDSAFWGPEFRNYLEQFERKNFELQFVEYPKPDLVQIKESQCEKSEKVNILSAMIKSKNLTQKLLLDLYEHYLRHTFPSYYMNFGSFKIYLQKCGLKSDAITNYGKQMFRCCLTRPKRNCKGKTYIDFYDICYLVIGLDPEFPNDKQRQAFIVHLQQCRETSDEDKENKALQRKSGRFVKSKQNLAEIYPSKLLTKVSSMLRKLPGDDMEIGDYRLPKSIFSKFGGLKKKKERLVSDKSSLSRGLCMNCRVKCFEYGQHCIMFDSMGRCVEPKIILNADNQFVPISNLEGKKLYSAEYVFKPDSIGNALFDYMRNRKFLLNENNNKESKEKECNTSGGGGGEKVEEDYLINAILTICESVRKLLKHEPRLIKRSGPAVIIGDIRGNLDSLFTMETLFWRPMPVIAQNLIFLGNYTGKSNYNIETIIYLFSIKYLCPNKVILLKGCRETRTHNRDTLLAECRTRYGEEKGSKLWEAINKVYDEMPFVCIINESIVCTSSGIPKDSIKHKLTTLFDNYVLDTQNSSSLQPREFAIFQHILMNIPDHHSGSDNAPTKSKQNSQILFKPNPSMPNEPNAFMFTREAFRQFMELNNFSYMIRSNEYILEGYRLSFNNQLISIFSNVEGTRGKNEAIVAFVHHPNGQIQLEQIEH